MATRITVSVPDEMAQAIKDQLEYGDNRSRWIREAIQLKLDQEREEGNRYQATAMEAN